MESETSDLGFPALLEPKEDTKVNMGIGRTRVLTSGSHWTVSQLGDFYVKHRSSLVSHAQRLLFDRSRAEEIVQDALVKVLLAAPELANEEHALSYIHRSIENLCIDYFRMNGRRPNLTVIDEASLEDEGSWQIQADHSDVVAAADDAAIVRQALSMLSPAERAALVMWEIEGRSSREIARELGIRESSVRHTVSRARASLRRVLSHYVIDEARGLTALDFLSTSYKRSSDLVKKSSKVALSAILIFFAFLGFGNFDSSENSNLPLVSSHEVAKNSVAVVPSPINSSSSSDKKLELARTTKSSTNGSNVKSTEMSFPGLDKNGIPVGFTITDSQDSLGQLFVSGRGISTTESEFASTQILKTVSGAANLLITQTLTVGMDGIRYSPIVSYGSDGMWNPLVTKVSSFDISRQMGGNYLVTAIVTVESRVESSIKVPATAGGRDLDFPPRQIVTRLVLDPSKTQVLAQAVRVIEKGVK